ncbi:hypothetical protein NDU88_004711 [Pleurodeles waltl]|uniref:Uncharacterized protein n=1 Tax=Pleurodeles waltl TaxID=8319 RepID=A0AAV7UHT1_PLEWA|nr:hypothetical protein NDU88_004711 [Pleurodeles waltl]
MRGPWEAEDVPPGPQLERARATSIQSGNAVSPSRPRQTLGDAWSPATTVEVANGAPEAQYGFAIPSNKVPTHSK